MKPLTKEEDKELAASQDLRQKAAAKCLPFILRLKLDGLISDKEERAIFYLMSLSITPEKKRYVTLDEKEVFEATGLSVAELGEVMNRLIERGFFPPNPFRGGLNG